jgi:integrase
MNTPAPQIAPDRLHFQVTRHNGKVRVAPTIHLDSSPRRRKKPIYVQGCPLPIYPTRWTRKATRRTYVGYVIAWRDAAGRKREKHSELQKAKDRVQEIWTNVLNGQAAQNQFSEADRASYRRALELLQPTGKSLELAVADYTESVQMLGGRSLQEAVKFFIEHQPKDVTPKNLPDLVADLLGEKRRKGKGEKWLATLGQQLDTFSEWFDCPLHAIQAHEVTARLDGLQVGLRTRKNYRDAFRELVRFAQAQGQLSRAWDELRHVEEAEVPPVDVVIYLPDQVRLLLSKRLEVESNGRCGGTMIPFLALSFFAGVRHEEMHQRGNAKAVLDWSDIDLEAGFVTIRATVGKTKRRRSIKMHPNLIKWLTPYAKDTGPVCELSQIAGALDRTKKLAGLPNLRGMAKNVGRKSFASYRLAETNDIGLTSREAGNSPQVIRDNYEKVTTAALAADFFSIMPPRTDPLFAWGEEHGHESKAKANK